MHMGLPLRPKNATPSLDTKSGRESDRKEISLKEKHTRLHKPDPRAYSSPLPAAAIGYSHVVGFTLCARLLFHMQMKVSQSAVNPRVALKRISTNKYLERQLTPSFHLPFFTGWKLLLSFASPHYPRGGLSLISSAQTTSGILQTPLGKRKKKG